MYVYVVPTHTVNTVCIAYRKEIVPLYVYICINVHMHLHLHFLHLQSVNNGLIKLLYITKSQH